MTMNLENHDEIFEWARSFDRWARRNWYLCPDRPTLESFYTLINVSQVN